MNGRRGAITAAIVVLAAGIGWLLFVGLPRWYGAPIASPTAAAARPAPSASEPLRKIKARLFYVADDGVRLLALERDVPYGEGTVEQARQIIQAQVAPIAQPFVSAVPAGTTLRALFMTEKGQAIVDLSREAASAHPGGTTTELLTVYTIVNALTINLPAVTSVQLLVDGKEVDTLAGHVDLRRPLARNEAIVQAAAPAVQPTAGPPAAPQTPPSAPPAEPRRR